LFLTEEQWELAEDILNRFENYDVNETNFLGDTPLLLAARLKCGSGLFKKILNRTNSENVNKADEVGNTALHYAIDQKYEFATKELLNHNNVNVNVITNNNRTPLHRACLNWRDIPVDLFKLIIEKSIDINAQDNNGTTPFHYSIIGGSEFKTKELTKTRTGTST
jgi:ankyrin repeat protein